MPVPHIPAAGRITIDALSHQVIDLALDAIARAAAKA